MTTTTNKKTHRGTQERPCRIEKENEVPLTTNSSVTIGAGIVGLSTPPPKTSASIDVVPPTPLRRSTRSVSKDIQLDLCSVRRVLKF